MRRRLGLSVLLTAILCGCTSTPNPVPSATGSTAAAPTEAERLARAAVTTFNAGAGRPPAEQQRALAGLVAPGQQAAQRACPAATRTLRLEPVYSALAPAPGWRPPSGTMAGTVYSLPTLIRVYSGTRLIGTDLTDLHLTVVDGRAGLSALCVS